jgi:hypothetical protein
MLVRRHAKAWPATEVVIMEEEEQLEGENKGRVDEGEEEEPKEKLKVGHLSESKRNQELLKVGHMRKRQFQHSLNRWRGRMRKQF